MNMIDGFNYKNSMIILMSINAIMIKYSSCLLLIFQIWFIMVMKIIYLNLMMILMSYYIFSYYFYWN